MSKLSKWIEPVSEDVDPEDLNVDDLNLDDITLAMGQDIDFIFRELSALESDVPTTIVQPGSSSGGDGGGGGGGSPKGDVSDEVSVVSINQDTAMGATAKIKFTLGTVASVLRKSERGMGRSESKRSVSAGGSAAGSRRHVTRQSQRQKQRQSAAAVRPAPFRGDAGPAALLPRGGGASPLNKAEPLLIDEDGFIISATPAPDGDKLFGSADSFGGGGGSKSGGGGKKGGEDADDGSRGEAGATPEREPPADSGGRPSSAAAAAAPEERRRTGGGTGGAGPPRPGMPSAREGKPWESVRDVPSDRDGAPTQPIITRPSDAATRRATLLAVQQVCDADADTGADDLESIVELTEADRGELAERIVSGPGGARSRKATEESDADDMESIVELSEADKAEVAEKIISGPRGVHIRKASFEISRRMATNGPQRADITPEHPPAAGDTSIGPDGNKESRINEVEVATKRRIHMLRKIVAQKAAQATEEYQRPSSTNSARAALNNKLDFVESETMKQISRLRNRLGTDGQGGN